MLSLTLALLLCGIASAIYGFAQVDNNANGGLFCWFGCCVNSVYDMRNVRFCEDRT